MVDKRKVNWSPIPPPKNIVFQTWWVWDGEHIFLARWDVEYATWDLVEPSPFEFRPENVTHYQVLERPDEP